MTNQNGPTFAQGLNFLVVSLVILALGVGALPTMGWLVTRNQPPKPEQREYMRVPGPENVYQAPMGWEPCGLGHANGSVLLRRRVR